jgi:hypothetical protein
MQTMALFSYVKHPDVPLYALAYHLVDVLAIINKDGEVITKLYGPHFISQTPARGMMKRYEAYHSIKCDSDYIYCAFKGFELELSMTEMPLMASTINMFTWKGEPVASLKLDHTFQEFEIVPEYSKIIIFSPENGKLVKYDMPNFKRSEL